MVGQADVGTHVVRFGPSTSMCLVVLAACCVSPFGRMVSLEVVMMRYFVVTMIGRRWRRLLFVLLLFFLRWLLQNFENIVLMFAVWGH